MVLDALTWKIYTEHKRHSKAGDRITKIYKYINNNYKGTDSEYKDIFSVDPDVKIGQGKGYFYTLFIIWLVSLPLSIGIIILGLLKIN